jgi:ABC-type bacteriocin/lantibiotic exporter with double-glycine peptidase domain
VLLAVALLSALVRANVRMRPAGVAAVLLLLVVVDDVMLAGDARLLSVLQLLSLTRIVTGALASACRSRALSSCSLRRPAALSSCRSCSCW